METRRRVLVLEPFTAATSRPRTTTSTESSRSKGGPTEAARKLDIAQKLKSREQELWSASSALVFLTEERDEVG